METIELFAGLTAGVSIGGTIFFLYKLKKESEFMESVYHELGIPENDDTPYEADRLKNLVHYLHGDKKAILGSMILDETDPEEAALSERIESALSPALTRLKNGETLPDIIKEEKLAENYVFGTPILRLEKVPEILTLVYEERNTDLKYASSL